jgi:hypothetical protein
MYVEIKGIDPMGLTFEVTQDNVETLGELAALFRQFTLASGFTYVQEVAIEKDSGDMVWSDEY